MSYSTETFLLQTGLKSLGFDPGPLDGYRGSKTANALSAYLDGQKKPLTTSSIKKLKAPHFSTASRTAFFGKAGKIAMATFTPPFPMVFSWDNKPVGVISCHKLIAPAMEEALKEIFNTYGLAWIHKHGLHLYAGCFNYRNGRGSRSLSDHAFAAAFDFNPDANGNSTTWKPGTKGANGTFQMPKEAVAIFEKYGFKVGFKRSNGTRRDMMHVAFINRA